MTITLLALGLGFVEYQGLVAYPPDVSSTFLQLDILGALDVAMVAVIASFLFVNLFDTAGTLLGVANRANLVDDQAVLKIWIKRSKQTVPLAFLCFVRMRPSHQLC